MSRFVVAHVARWCFSGSSLILPMTRLPVTRFLVALLAGRHGP